MGRSGSPSNTWFLGPTQVQIPNNISIASVVLHSSGQRVAILDNRPPVFPVKLPLLMGDLEPHLIHGSLHPPESSTQTASPSVESFSQGSILWQTDRQTDRPRYSVGNNRPHLHTYYCDAAYTHFYSSVRSWLERWRQHRSCHYCLILWTRWEVKSWA